MFKALSLLTCSYNTPEVLELCLKSFVYHHGKGPHKIVIVENSTEPQTQQLLDFHNILYMKNPKGTHSPSVDLALNRVTTDYSLLIDTDVIFKKNIGEIYEKFKGQQLTLLGEMQGNRGGFLLHPRIAPHFCFINMDHIRTRNINFHNEQKIVNTNSTGFFKNIPLNYEQRDRKYYDVGSVFFEDVQKNGLKISNLQDIGNYVFHAESLSWALHTHIYEYMKMGTNRQDSFYKMAMEYQDVEIKNCFEGYF